MCSGGGSLAPEDRAELLAILSGDTDEAIAERAAGSLLSLPIDSFRAALARADAAPQLFEYCAHNLADKPGVADALAANPNCPAELLLFAVRHLTTSVVQKLMDDLDRLSSAPALAAALATSASLTAEQRQQLQELQQDSPNRAALEEAAAAVTELDKERRQTLLQKLSGMRVSERVQLALKGNREDRLFLIRDPSRVVQRAVLQSPRITDREIEAFSAMASLTDEVLRLISKNRNFRKNYTVLLNLMNNPKTPLDVSLHMLTSLNATDLKKLTVNKNISETLRKAAIQLQRKRTELGKRGE